jgi:hypothetical protein
MFTNSLAMQNRLFNLLDLVRNFGNKYDVCAAGNSGMEGDPTGIASHYFNDEYASMAFSRGMKLIERVASGINSGIESKGDYGGADIVVNRLGNADKRYAFFVKLLCDAQCAVAADNDQCIEQELLEIRNHDFRNVALASFSVFGDGITKGIGRAGRTEDGTAEVQNARDALHRKRSSVAMHKTVESFFDSDDFPTVANGGFDRCTDNRIKSRTIPTAGENSDFHGQIVLDLQTFFQRYFRGFEGV